MCWGSGFPGMPKSKKSKFNCWPLHLSPRVVQRFSGPGEFRMPGPAGLKRAFFRILNFQNKLGPIRGKFEKPKLRNKKGFFFILYCNKINMDLADDFEVLRPFSSFSGEI